MFTISVMCRRREQGMKMLQKLTQKVRSASGATIMFALLTFLVCMVIGSIILVTGTAAAG